MHGRPRLPVGQSPDKSKDQGKAGKLKLLLAEVLRNHHERCYTIEALKRNAQLLELNPEVYTAWNYRKLAIRHLMDLEPEESARKLMAEDELRLVERALQVNVKSYGAWYHRKWIIQLGLSSLDHEFLLLKKLLKDDSRNFHGWDYRRFAVKIHNVPAEKELEYATEKINENFSNYSAWHYRSTLLSQVVKGEVSKEEIIEDEYALVNQAYFTEPDDQSAWFYNTWLLGETTTNSGPQLLGTWPLNGSTVSAEIDKLNQSSAVRVSSRDPLKNEYRFYSKEVPLVISFSDVITCVNVKVSTEPELGCLDDIQWRSLSSSQGPAKTWIAEFPVRELSEIEYSISFRITHPGRTGQGTEIKFNLRVTSGCISRENAERGDNGKSCKRGLFWPSEFLYGEEQEGRRHELVQEGTRSSVVKEGQVEAVPEDVLLSDESQKESLTSDVRKVDWQQKLLEKQVKNLRELLELEKDSKWAKLTLSRVLLVLGAHTHTYGRFTDEVLDLLKELARIDPVHASYYDSLVSSIFIAKVLRNTESLKQLWWDSPPAAGKHFEKVGWLRWSGLSLSKFDSVERLLWVQRLDLSHNKLRSLDGLEAMQLLVSLDVSNNHIPHVTSLAAIRLIPHLEFLNLSHNEIGSHPVDCTRYCLPSVLSNQIKHLFPKGEVLHNDIMSEDKWEVWAVFGGLVLRVLEIAGNEAAMNEVFKKSLVKALPSLELLDGEEVR